MTVGCGPLPPRNAGDWRETRGSCVYCPSPRAYAIASFCLSVVPLMTPTGSSLGVEIGEYHFVSQGTTVFRCNQHIQSERVTVGVQ